MIPALLLALATLVMVPLYPGDIPSNPRAEAALPIYLSIDAPAGSTPITPEAARAATRMVERTVAHLEAMRVSVAPAGRGGFLVTPGPSGNRVVVPATATGTTVPIPAGVIRLSAGFNSSSVSAASGSETLFTGDGEAPWRLASQIQRNVVGGLRDVLGYDSYDRGTVEESAKPDVAHGLSTSEPWVATYPLFATNSWESALMQQPGSEDVLSAALANAIYAYLDPGVATPRRVEQSGWRRAPSWQPVEPKAVFQSDHPAKLALTFDGGASSAPTPAILKALKDAGVRATMFMTADFVERNPELVVQMARDGHEFGNHSATHPDMTKVSSAEMVAELDRLERAVMALTGKSTRPWFRPPFGAYNDRVLAVAAEQGYQAIMWTADSADWRAELPAATIEGRLLRYAAPGAILIEHLGSPQSAQVLPEVLSALKERGMTFGTLSEVLERP